MAKRLQKSLDPQLTLDQAEAAAKADERFEAHRLLRAYRRWRLKGNTVPPGSDERYGELVELTGPKVTVTFAEPSSSEPPTIPERALRPLADLLLHLVQRKREKYRGVVVDPVVALQEAEVALDRGNLEAAEKHLEDYDGFCVCGGQEPPGGKEQYELLQKRWSALNRQP